MTTDSETLHTDQQIFKMGLSIQNEKFNDIAPMIILESADQFYDSEQVIISNDLGITDLTNNRFGNDNVHKNKAFDETRFSITVIDNEKIDKELMECFENIQPDNFNVLNEVTDYTELAAVNEMHKYFNEDISVCDDMYMLSSPSPDPEIKIKNTSSNTTKEDGSLDCILKTLLIEPKNSEVSSEIVPSPNLCKRTALDRDCPEIKKVKGNVEVELNKPIKTEVKSGKESDNTLKKECPLNGENIQILKIETKLPKPCSVDKDLTSLNWLQKLNIVSVPSLPTPPSSPTFQKNNCKKPNSFSLRLQHGKYKYS